MDESRPVRASTARARAWKTPTGTVSRPHELGERCARTERSRARAEFANATLRCATGPARPTLVDDGAPRAVGVSLFAEMQEKERAGCQVYSRRVPGSTPSSSDRSPGIAVRARGSQGWRLRGACLRDGTGTMCGNEEIGHPEIRSRRCGRVTGRS